MTLRRRWRLYARRRLHRDRLRELVPELAVGSYALAGLEELAYRTSLGKISATRPMPVLEYVLRQRDRRYPWVPPLPSVLPSQQTRGLTASGVHARMRVLVQQAYETHEDQYTSMQWSCRCLTVPTAKAQLPQSQQHRQQDPAVVVARSAQPLHASERGRYVSSDIFHGRSRNP